MHSPNIRYLREIIDNFNRGCSSYQEAIAAWQSGNFFGYEKALLTAESLVVGAMEEALRIYLKGLPSLSAQERSTVQHPKFFDLITLMEQYANPPLKPEMLNLLFDYSDVRNAVDYRAAAPSIQYLGEAIPLIRQALLLYLPVEADQLHQIQVPITRKESEPEPLAPFDTPPESIRPRKAVLIGKKLGRYRIDAQLGQGGMAAVYKAYDLKMKRNVALKILPQRFANDPDYVKRFEQEAEVLANLQHPYILSVHDSGQIDGYTFIVMPLVESGTLAALLRGGPLPLREIRHIMTQVGQALGYAHAQDLVHRDIKPSNVLLDESGNCLLADFGIVKIIEGTAKLTGTGVGIGTPEYMSPEQGQGRDLDGRSDLYSLGVMLYEMATGQVPFTGPREAMLVRHQLHTPPSPRNLNPSLPEVLEQIILKLLAKQPEDRYATADDLIRAMQAVDDNDDDDTKPPPQPDPPTLPPEFIDTMTSHLRHSWLVDPWDEANPYRLLEDFKIGPMSSIREIQNYSPDPMTEPQRLAWEQLRDLSSRLFVDSFLYRAAQSHDLMAMAKEHLATDQTLPPIEQVSSSLQAEWPLVLLLADQREEALTLWAEIWRSQRAQTEPAVIHHLALTYTFLAQHQEQSGQIEAAITTWRRAIAYWVYLLAQDDFWTAWAKSRAGRYQKQVTPQHLIDLRQQLHHHFSHRFIEESQALPADCPPETRQTYQALSLAWQIEWAGLQALQQLHLDQPHSPKIEPLVGPSLIAELELTEVLAQLVLAYTRVAEDIVRAWSLSLDQRQAQQNVRLVRLYYSQLGQAAAWLASSQPDQALTALAAVEESPDFERSNPPYRLLPDQQVMWQKDRTDVAIRAHLESAQLQLQAKQWDIKAVLALWTKSLSLGAAINEIERVLEMIHEQALAHLQPISKEANRSDQQLALAEATRQTVGPTPELTTILKALRDRQPKKPATSPEPPKPLSGTDFTGELRKWKTVLQVNPTDEVAQEQAARLLSHQLEYLLAENQLETARQIAAEWRTMVAAPPRLLELFRYLQHGYHVASYLSQTELQYSPDLFEANTYSFGFHLKHVDVFAELKVEGDLVRISGPILDVMRDFEPDIQRNLLQVTWDMPLYKVQRQPGGGYNLVVEILANWLTPALLEQLVRSLASRIDLTLTHLQSLPVLQRKMGKYIPDYSLHTGQLPSQSELKAWQSQLLAQCQQLDLECRIARDLIFLKRPASPEVAVQLDFQTPLVIFQARLADQPLSDQTLYEQLLEKNSLIKLGKLTLDPAGAVVLRWDALALDDEATLARLLDLVFEGITQSESLLT